MQHQDKKIIFVRKFKFYLDSYILFEFILSKPIYQLFQFTKASHKSEWLITKLFLHLIIILFFSYYRGMSFAIPKA